MCNADPTQAFCGANGEPNPIAKYPIPNDQQLVGFPNIHYIYIIELCVYIYIIIALLESIVGACPMFFFFG